MDKVQKSIAKLYFALGEREAQKPSNAGSVGSVAECLAYLAVRNTGESIGARYFSMGAASALRRAAEPPRGRRLSAAKPGKPKPPAGGKPEKRSKLFKSISRSAEDLMFDDSEFFEEG